MTDARVGQIVQEALYNTSPPVRVGGLVREALYATNPPVWAGQLVRETLYAVPPTISPLNSRLLPRPDEFVSDETPWLQRRIRFPITATAAVIVPPPRLAFVGEEPADTTPWLQRRLTAPTTTVAPPPRRSAMEETADPIPWLQVRQHPFRPRHLHMFVNT